MTQLIGFNGFKRTGKDTAAGLVSKMLTDNGEEVVTRAFAHKLKVAAARALGFDRAEDELVALMDSFKEVALFQVNYVEPDDPKKAVKMHELTGREYLQWFGTEAGRETFADEFWVDLVLPQPAVAAAGWGDPTINPLDLAYPGVDMLLVTDVRFPNEARRVKALGGKVVEITRPGIDGGAHASEKPLPRELVDVTIDNAGSFEDFERKLVAVL